MKVLAIMCHPDDMELLCAGTLLKYKKAGHDVIACHAANGNMGHFVIMPDELREIRKKEAQNAGAIAGYEVISLDIDDLTVNSADEEQIDKVIKVIRYAKPDVIITHSPTDYCSDHRELSQLVFNASFSASCPHFKPELGEATPVTPLYYAENDNSIDFCPTEYVDITDEMSTKEEMLRCHESQLVWLLEHDNNDIVETQRRRAEAWGRQCGVKYAEVFKMCHATGRMRTYRLLP